MQASTLLRPVPKVLESVENPPKQLFAVGNEALLNEPLVAIVGTRRPNAYTKEKTHALAAAIAQAGGVVVSGGAMGVDALAHKGAGGRTIAVMANSLDIIYPKVNRPLIEEIYARGLALSEHETAHEARSYDFILRNRIVVGLAQAVVVAEADLKSGSMSSAQFAIKTGKPLYVLPHRMGESEGTQELLASGAARPITSIEGFVRSLGLRAASKDADEFLAHVARHPDYHAALARFGDRVFEYELNGLIDVVNGQIRLTGV